MKHLFEDLRFFIGAFFFLVGLILFIQALVAPSQVEGLNLNLYAGVGFLVFSVGAFALTWQASAQKRIHERSQKRHK